MIKLSPAERTPKRVKGFTPQERIPERTQIVDLLVPKMLEEVQERTPSVYTHRPSINQATMHAEIPQHPCADTVVDMLVVMQRQVPHIQTANKPSIN